MKLKQIRESKGLTQRELTNILNLKPTTYNGYEKGVCEPNISTLIKLADFYKITVDELIGHNIPYLINKSLLTDKQNYLINIITDLSDNQCDKVEAYIMGLQMANIEKDITIEKLRRK